MATAIGRTTKKGRASTTRPAPRDYVGVAEAYAKRAADEANSASFGRWTRLAAQRFLDDLERAKQKDAPFYFDRWHAADPCGFIEKLPHVEGTWDTPTITLHESDVFFLVNLFGFRRAGGARRFSTALKAVARKNAKSTIAAGIALYCETCEGERGPQVISGATTGSQARIIFNIAKRMVERTAALRQAFGLEAFSSAISCFSNGGTFKPINSKASSQDGLNPSAVMLDEIHAHKTHDLVNVLRSAAGARGNPLFLFTTTEGYETPGPWPEIRHFAKQVLAGILRADHFLVAYYALDDDDEDFDEACWIKANPLMDVNPLLLREIRKEAVEAKEMPGRLSEFRIKRLNRPASSAGGWVNLVQWKACDGRVDLAKLKGAPCWGGLDLASTRDITSFRLVWKIDGEWWTRGWRFVPRAAVKNRTERGLVPYRGWVDAKLLLEAGDEVTDYDAVEQTVLQARSEYNVRLIGYDPWNAKQLSQKLIEQGVPMEEFVQGTKSYHPAMQELERAYVSGAFRNDADPVLAWCASNLVARTDVNLNTAPDKKRSPEKIDDMAALLMALGVAIRPGGKPEPKYQTLFL